MTATMDNSEPAHTSAPEYDWKYADLQALSRDDVSRSVEGHDALRFAYLDSGPSPESVKGEDAGYTTVVCVHGHTYTARTFSRALHAATADFASSSLSTSTSSISNSSSSTRRLRLVAVNRRDYAPSTLLTSKELAQSFASGPNATNSHGSYLRARAVELARFLVWVVDNLIASSSSEDVEGNSDKGEGGAQGGGGSDQSKSAGGLAVLGWSLGTVTVLALLAFLRERRSGLEADNNLRKRLKRELRRVFLLEPLPTFLGYAHPAGWYNPVNFASNDPNAGLKIDAWLRSYNVHPCFAAEDMLTLEDVVSKDTSTDTVVHDMPDGDDLKNNSSTDVVKEYSTLAPNTLGKATEFTPELLTCLDSEPGARSEIAFYTCIARDTLEEQRRKAFGITSEDGKDFGNCERDEVDDIPITIAYGGASVWAAPWSARKLARDCRYATPTSQTSTSTVATIDPGSALMSNDLLITSSWESRKGIEIIRIPGANHFIVWDEPERFVRVLARTLAEPIARDSLKRNVVSLARAETQKETPDGSGLLSRI